MTDEVDLLHVRAFRITRKLFELLLAGWRELGLVEAEQDVRRERYFLDHDRLWRGRRRERQRCRLGRGRRCGRDRRRSNGSARYCIARRSGFVRRPVAAGVPAETEG